VPKIIFSLHKESLLLGFRNILPIMPSVIGFGLIFGFTGSALSNLSLIIVSSMSYIIFAGSAQFLVLILIIEGEPIIGLIIAGILINLRHLLYGANLNPIIKARKIKKVFMAYLLTDEAFLITSLTKKRLEEQSSSINQYNLDDVLIGAGFTLWSIWNLSTIIGYLIAPIVEEVLFFEADFILSVTFLGYLIMHWQENPFERNFITILALLSFILAFFLQSSILLITILLFGIIITVLSQAINDKKSEKRKMAGS
jgi:predicted branched-subunit amino acid permease